MRSRHAITIPLNEQPAAARQAEIAMAMTQAQRVLLARQTSTYRFCCPTFTLREGTMLERIQVDPRVCEGRPTIRGLRITVEFVLKLLGDGYTAADIVREYPELEEEDVYQAAKYGAWLAAERTSAIG